MSVGCPTGFDPVPAGSQSAMQSHYTTGTTGTTHAICARVDPLQPSGTRLLGDGRVRGRPRRICTDYLPVMSGTHICTCSRTSMVGAE